MLASAVKHPQSSEEDQYHQRECVNWYISCVVQACYGHTEGAAGTTGLLLAIQSMSQRSAAGIMCLRDVNPYVSAAIADWEKRTGLAPLLPRQRGALCETLLAGVILCTSFVF